MDEARQQEYFELVQQLLQCEGGTEAEILQAHPKLVDEDLVMTLLAVAQMMKEQNDPERESTIEWLTDFASQLAADLGLDLEDRDKPQADDMEHLQFFQTLLQVLMERQGDGKIVHQFFDNHPAQLNAIFTAKLPNLVRMFLAQSDDAQIHSQLASLIHNLAVDLTEFPRGDRAQNLELAITCYRLALSVYTRADYPEQWAMTQMNLAITYRNRIKGERAADRKSVV